MLKVTADDLWSEIHDAETLRDDYLVAWKAILVRWLGRTYRDSLKGRPSPENYIHGYLAFVLPQLVWEYPIVQVEPERSAADIELAQMMEYAINYWIKKVDYRTHLARLARDMILGFGVSFTGYSLREHVGAQVALHSQEAMGAIPFARRIEPGDYLCDAHARCYEERRFEGRIFERDYDDLLEDDRYDTDVLRKLAPNTRQRERSDDLGDNKKARSERRTLTLYELWIPEHNLIVTLAESGRYDGPIVRKAEYYGPSTGPYQLWGVYDVPGQIYPFSPIAGIYDQFEELNMHALAAQQCARQYRRIGVFRRTNSEDGQAVQKAKHGDFVGLSDPESVREMEIGGMTQSQVMLLELLRDRLDRTMGYSDAQRGQVAKNTTATAHSIAQNNAALRVDWIRQALVSCAERELRRIGWWFWNERTIVMDIVIVDGGFGRDATVLGGKPEEEVVSALLAAGMLSQQMARSIMDSDWVDYRLRILPESLVKQADPVSQKRSQDEWALAMNMAQIIGPQNINWVGLLDRVGNAYNTRNLSRIILMPGAMQQLQVQAMAGAGGLGVQQSSGMSGPGPQASAPQVQQAMSGAQESQAVSPQAIGNQALQEALAGSTL